MTRTHSTSAVTVSVYDCSVTLPFTVTVDGNGNIMALVSEANGEIVAQYEYGPFGELLKADGDLAQANPFRFSTKHLDENGLAYYGYRYYDAEVGRWLNRDPIMESGGVNTYGFVDNSPLVDADYLGLDGWLKRSARATGSGIAVVGKTAGTVVVGTAKVGVNVVKNVGGGAVEIAKHPSKAPQLAVGLAGSVLSGDACFDMEGVVDLNDASCKFLITVTGWNSNRRANQEFHNKIREISPYSEAKNTAWFYNPTTVIPLVDDLAQSIVQDVVKGIDLASQKFAKIAKQAYAKAKANSCREECTFIYVVAHSQGTAVVNRGLPMLDADVQKRLWLVGLGGQNAFRTDTGDHLMVRNIVHEKDIVPKVPNQPVNVLRKPRIEKFSNKDVGLPEGVNEGLVSSHVLHNGGYYRYLQKSPLPPEMMR